MRHDNSPAAAYAWLVFLALVVGVALALLLWPRPAGAQPVAPCATPGVVRPMPTARVGRPMDARPTYSARLAMPTSGAVTPGGSGR